MRKRGYLQISFAWLFAIIVGAVILFFAIFLSTKLINTEQTTLDAKTGKQIGILLNPLETSFESVKTTSFTVPAETRIYNKCKTEGNFGSQIIQISQKSFNKWTETDIDVSFYNKYIFSEEYVEGKKFYVFSKPFKFPFKVADLIYITSSLKDYCFIKPPEEIEEEILNLNQKNLLVDNCSEGSVKVCFGFGDCEINVYSDYIKKNEETISFEGDALMYAAIFSDKEVYECQLKRLLKRTEHLALLYRNKAKFISPRGCYSDLNSDLLGLNNAAKSLSESDEDISGSGDLNYVGSLVELIKDKNEANKGCKLW
ncbi:hypothetical protein KAJ87_04335 [Candidatus Pacearchaeota archaeon]|nr:hypothetical protein [Candidatus Pacearchaeota archaeon]